MILYRKISVKERLPKKDGRYVFFFKVVSSGKTSKKDVMAYGEFTKDSMEDGKMIGCFVEEHSAEHAWVTYPYEDSYYCIATAWLEKTDFPE